MTATRSFCNSTVPLPPRRRRVRAPGLPRTASDLSHRYLWGPAVDQLMADEQLSPVNGGGYQLRRRAAWSGR